MAGQRVQYCLQNDYDLFNQLINSVQRQVRILGKDSCEHILQLAKILKISISEIKKNKPEKIQAIIDKFPQTNVTYFAPTLLIQRDSEFVNKLCSSEVLH